MVVRILIEDRVVSLQVAATDTIDSVKEQIRRTVGIPKRHQRLIYVDNGDLLAGRTLRSYGIQDGASAHLVIRHPMKAMMRMCIESAKRRRLIDQLAALERQSDLSDALSYCEFQEGGEEEEPAENSD